MPRDCSSRVRRRLTRYCGVNLERARYLYMRAGFTVNSLENPSAGLLNTHLITAPIHVLHVTGTLSETSDGKVYLDFASRGEGSREALSASLLASLLTSQPQSQRRPLIVLDVLRPPGPSEAARQLFLPDDLFAAELFALGGDLGRHCGGPCS